MVCQFHAALLLRHPFSFTMAILQTKMDSSSLAPLILCPIFYIVFTPVVITIWVANQFVRLLVALLLRFNYGSSIKLVEDGCDGIWNYKTNGNIRNCFLAGTFRRGAIEGRNFGDFFERHVLLHREDRRTPWGRKVNYRPYKKLEHIMVTRYGYTCWKFDENFSIRKHIRVLDDKPVYTENDVMNLLSILSQDMDETKPQWEMIFINNYQDTKGEEKSLLLIRFHHAYMDGLSILLMFSRYMCPNVTLPLDPLNVRLETWKKVLYYTNAFIYAPHKFLTMMLNRYGVYWKPISPFPGGRKNYVVAPAVDMKVMKEIRANTGASVPNIVCTAFIAAMKKVLPKERIIDSLRIGEMVARIPYPNGDPQNRFAPFSYDVSSGDIGESPVDFCEAIAQIRRDRQMAMMGPEPLLFTFVARLIGTLPTFVMPLVMDGVHDSIFYSNVPAYKELMEFEGVVLEDFSGWPPIPNQTGITIASVSCGDTLKISGVADSSWLTSEELGRIFIEIPKVIHAVAAKGFIPTSIPEGETGRTESPSEDTKEDIIEPTEESGDAVEGEYGGSGSDTDSRSEISEEAEAEEDVITINKRNTEDKITVRMRTKKVQKVNGEQLAKINGETALVNDEHRD